LGTSNFERGNVERRTSNVERGVAELEC